MTTKPLTLLEAAELMKTLPVEEAIQREDLNLFVERVETAGKNILQHKGGEYIEEVSILLLSSVMAELLQDKSNMQIFMLLQSRPDIFQLILGYAFIYSVGLGVVEELY